MALDLEPIGDSGLSLEPVEGPQLNLEPTHKTETTAELTSAQANEARLGHLAIAPSIPIPAWLEDYLIRTGRRMSAGQEAFYNIPENAKNLVTGGGQGRLDAGLRLAQGLTYPVAAPLMAGVEAPVEGALAGFGVPEHTAQTVADFSSIPLAVALGRADQAGKLGTAGQSLAELLGVRAEQPKPIAADFKASQEIPLSEVVREQTPFQPRSAPVAGEEELLGQLLSKESPDQLMA